MVKKKALRAKANAMYRLKNGTRVHVTHADSKSVTGFTMMSHQQIDFTPAQFAEQVAEKLA